MLGGPQGPWIVVARDVVFILHMAKLTSTAERIFKFWNLEIVFLCLFEKVAPASTGFRSTLFFFFFFALDLGDSIKMIPTEGNFGGRGLFILHWNLEGRMKKGGNPRFPMAHHSGHMDWLCQWCGGWQKEVRA